MGKASDQFHSRYHFAFWWRSFKLISLPYVLEDRYWPRSLCPIMGFGKISSLFDYCPDTTWRYFTKSKFKYNYKLITPLNLIRRWFQNLTFKNISLCLSKHICRSLTEYVTLNSFKLALNSCILYDAIYNVSRQSIVKQGFQKTPFPILLKLETFFAVDFVNV